MSKDYICECGRIFNTPQGYSGHRSRCKTNPNSSKVFECDYCGDKIVGLYNYNKHKTFCNQNPNRKEYLITKDTNEYKCQYCNKKCIGLLSLRCHERLCSHNPNRATSNFKKYNEEIHNGTKDSWSKGLTKYTHSSILKQSEKLIGREGNFKGRKHNDETKKHLSEVHTELWHKDDHRRTFSKSGWYNNEYMMSTYELAYYIYMKDSGHNIERCKERFPYIVDETKHYYYPDFKVDNSTIVEIKGFETELDRLKYTLVPNLLVLKYDDIKHCIKYVKDKYNVTDLSELYGGMVE